MEYERKTWGKLEGWGKFFRFMAWFIGILFLWSAALSLMLKPLVFIVDLIGALTVFPPFWDHLYRQKDIPDFIFSRWLRIFVLLVCISISNELNPDKETFSIEIEER